jgi:AcrR family transcriptional regulator
MDNAPMGKLIDRDKRERAKKKRVERKQRILRVARSTFARLPFVEVTLDSIGQRAGVDRGVASMYFRSTEELFLLLLREELGAWYTEIEDELSRSESKTSKSELAELLAAGLGARPELIRFLSLENVVLEQNIDAMEAFRFQRWRLDHMTKAGEKIESKVDGLAKGDGLGILHRVQLMSAALGPASDPKGAATYEVGDPDFAVFAIDFEPELRAFITQWLDSQKPNA